MKKYLLILFISITTLTASAQMTFKHLGALDGTSDLDFIKAKILAGAQPWTNAYNKMLTVATAGSTTTAPQDGNEGGQKDDGRKAYANAIAWYVSGNVKYANQAIGILNVWAKTFKGYTLPPAGEGNQSQLDCAWIGALLGPAAEIMRGYSGWNNADLLSVQNLFKTKFYPCLNQMSTWNGNVDLTQIDAMLNIAVFCEDETEFNLAVTRFNKRMPAYFYQTTDPANSRNIQGITFPNNWADQNGNLPTKYVDGLTQETCRDNDHHAQFAMASAIHAAEVAWHQGVDLFTPHAKRLIDAMELMAFQVTSGDMQGTCVDSKTTASLFDTWEVGYNHYHFRKGLSLPNTAKVLTTKVRINGASDWNIFFETVTHADIDNGVLVFCPQPDLGPDISICGQSSLILNAHVTSNGKTIKWYKDNNLISGQSGTTLTATSAGTYKVEVDSSTNCTLTDELIINGNLQVNLGADKELCNPTSYTLNAGNATVPNIAYSWNTGAKTRTVTADKSSTYTVTVSAPSCTSATDAVVVTSKLLNVSADTLCSAGTIKLTVNGTGTYNWYNVAAQGTSLYSGITYSPSISSSTIYYVEDAGSFESTLGKTDKGTGQSWNLGGADAGGTDKINKVTVLQALTLKSIAVYVTTANSSVTINFMQGTTTVKTKTFPGLAVGKQTLALNFDLAPGNYLINAVGTTGSIGFEASGGTFPYSVPGYISFTYNESWQSGWYGSFYDWKVISGSPCLRTPVYAVIDNTNINCVTSIEEHTSTSVFSVYPNPAKDLLIVSCEQLKSGTQNEIQIINSLGQIVYNSKSKIQNSVLSLDVSQFISGLYFIRIGNQTQKIVIQK